MGKNQRRQRCARCQQWVEEGAGELQRHEREEGGYEWLVTHSEPCEPKRRREDAPVTDDEPLWAVTCEGLTARGNQTRGSALVRGSVVAHEGVPMNDAARALAARWPAAPRQEVTALRRTILAQHGHTEESFEVLAEIRAKWLAVHWSRRVSIAEPLAADLPAMLEEGATT